MTTGTYGQTRESKGLKPHAWTRALFRIRVTGQEHLPFGGPALLVCDHMSPVERFLAGVSIARVIRFTLYRPGDETPPVNALMRLAKVIPAGTGGPAVGAVRRVRAELQAGQIVCISAESGISRTGDLLPFKSGIERIVRGLDVPIIPVCVHRAKASARVTVAFGPALPSCGLTAHAARLAIRELRASRRGVAGAQPADAEGLTFERT